MVSRPMRHKKSTVQLLSIVIALLSSSAAHGYTRSASAARPFVRPIDLEEIQVAPAKNGMVSAGVRPAKQDTKTMSTATIKKVQPIHQQQQQQRAVYDFGIGKNPPVYGKASQSPTLNPSEIDQESAQYWVEHEATRLFPSPLLTETTTTWRTPLEELATTPPAAAPTKKRPVPKVQPRRRTKDVLHIHNPPAPTNTQQHDRAPGAGSSSSNNSEKLLGMTTTAAVLPSMRRTSNVQLDVNTAWVEMMLHSEQMKNVPPTPSTPTKL